MSCTDRIALSVTAGDLENLRHAALMQAADTLRMLADDLDEVRVRANPAPDLLSGVPEGIRIARSDFETLEALGYGEGS